MSPGGIRVGFEPRPWKLWHLSVAVLATALVLGGLLALKRQAEEPLGLTLIPPALLGAFAFGFVGSAQVGFGLVRRHSGRLKHWGLDRGGVIGFLAWLTPNFLSLAILMGSIAVGIAACFALIWWIYFA